MSVTSIFADGWRAAYSGTPPTFAPDTSPEIVVTTRTGYDATATLHTNIAENLVINRRVRQTYPDQASETATDVALSDYVYSDDVISGVANNSVQASPMPVAAWVTPDRSLVGNSIGGEIVAFHRNGRNGRMVAALVVRATDGTTTVSATVAATIISPRAGDKNPLVVYAWTLDITALSAGIITVNAKVYPWIGGTAAVLDSASLSIAREFSPRYYVKNVSKAAAPPLAYISTTGSDTTHAGWSTNAATASNAPYLTVQGAINDAALSANTGVTGGIVDGCRIRITAGTFVLTSASMTRTQNAAELVVERDPTVARALCIVSFGAAAWRSRLGTGTLTAPITEGQVRFSDVSILRTGALTFMGESTTQLRVVFDDVNFDSGGFNGGILNNSHSYFYGLTATNMPATASMFTQSTYEVRIMRGVEADFSSGAPELWVLLANKLTGTKAAASRDPTKGGIIFCNKFLNPNSTSSPFSITATNAGETITGFVAGQNLIEVTHTTTSSPGLRVSSDTPAHGNTMHCMVFYNTVTGYVATGRHNIFYDNSTPTVLEVRTHNLNLFHGEVATQINIKGDVFCGLQGNVSPEQHVGNFAMVHGVGCAYNYSQFQTNSATYASEYQTYPGLGCKIGTSSVTAQADNAAVWTDYQGTTGSAGTPTAGAGGGNYTPILNSPLIGMIPNGKTLVSHSLSGTARRLNGTGASGAYELASLAAGAPLVTFTGLTSGSSRAITGAGIAANKLAANNGNPLLVTGMVVGSAGIASGDIGTFAYVVTETLAGATNTPLVTNLTLQITA